MARLVYIYQHLAKCGGRSFIRACSEWFPVYHEPLGDAPDRARIAEFARTRPDFHQWPDELFLHGHLIYDGIRPQERYADLIARGEAHLLTIVRDPLERKISSYFHRRRKGRSAGETLDQWLLASRNNQMRQLGVTAETWRAHLDTFFFVGVTEHLSASTNLFAAKIGRAPAPTPTLNASPRDDERPSPAALEAFYRANAVDYAIHAYALERLRREAAQWGVAL